MRIPSVSMYVKNATNTGVLNGLNSISSKRMQSSTMQGMNDIVSQYNQFKTNRSQIKAYYQEMYKGSSNKADSGDADTVVDTGLKNDIAALQESGSKLTTVGDKSLFNRNEEGSYDMESIVKAVDSFVKDYNALSKTASLSSNEKILQQAQSMNNLSATYSTVLSKVGISVGADNSLKLDTDKLKSADMTMVKALFNGSNSYAGRVVSTAGRMDSTAISTPSLEDFLPGYETYNNQGYASYTADYLKGSVMDYMV